jgi:predicted small integral membrane protein
MKKIINSIILFSLTLVLLSSCDRDMEFETISVTPPSLNVVVYANGDQAQRSANATVVISKVNPADGSTMTPSYFTKTTDATGSVKLTNAELLQIFPEPAAGQPRGGQLFFSVTSADNLLTGTLKSTYINMTDGETWQWVNIK